MKYDFGPNWISKRIVKYGLRVNFLLNIIILLPIVVAVRVENKANTIFGSLHGPLESGQTEQKYVKSYSRFASLRMRTMLMHNGLSDKAKHQKGPTPSFSWHGPSSHLKNVNFRIV